MLQTPQVEIIMSANRVAELEKQIKELKREEGRKDWVKVSESCSELVKYCKDHSAEDFLLHGSDKANPFKENKSFCIII